MIRKTTKEILADSFIELTASKPINKITITNITDNCGMTQPTFYRHFKDKYDLIAFIYVSDIRQLTDKIGVNGYEWRDALAESLEYFVEKRDFALNALKHTGGRDAFLLQMETTNIEMMSAVVRKKLMTEKIPEDISVMIQFYCCGYTHFICNWLLTNMQIPQNRAVDYMEKCLPSLLRPYLYP